MKAVIESSVLIRDRNVTSTYSFPVYSTQIEETLIRQLAFLRQYETFSLTMKLSKEKNDGSDLESHRSQN
jgi:hypothetical protein